MKNVSDKSFRETGNTLCVQVLFFRKSCLFWDNVEKCRSGQAINDNMAHAIACWIPSVRNIHWECVIITGFSLQKWLHEGRSMVRYTYIGCPVILNMRRLETWCSVVRIVLHCLTETNCNPSLIKGQEHVTNFNSWISAFSCTTMYLRSVWKLCVFNGRALCFCQQLWLFWWRFCNRSSEVRESTVMQPYCIWAPLGL